MSTKSKLEKTNQNLSKANQKLKAIKNAFLRPLPDYGDSLTEVKRVNLLLSNGNQGVLATPGKTMSEVIIERPSTLLPENIKRNVNIAGVNGEYDGSGIPGVERDSSGNIVISNDSETVYVNGFDNVVNLKNDTTLRLNLANDPVITTDNLKPENIKYGVNILNVEGTYIGGDETQEKSITPTRSTQAVTPDSGKYLSKVIVNPIPDEYIIPSGGIIISENGRNINVAEYATVTVQVSSGVTPTGQLAITNNGTYDVTNYASVKVNVPTSSGGASLDAINSLPSANKYNLGCYAKVSDTIYKCVQASGSNLLGYTDTLIGKTIKLDIEALRTDGKLYEGGTSTGTSNVYIDLVNANGSTYDAIRIQIKLKTVNGVNQIEEIYYLYYPGNTGYRYHWYCYGKTSADNTTTYKYFDDNTITFTTDNVQILNNYGFIKSDYQSNEWLEYLTIGDVTYNWVSQ